MPTLLMSHFLPPRTGRNKFLLFKPPSLWHSCSLPRRLVSSSVFTCRPHPLKTTQENPPSPPAQGPDPRRNETITARHPPQRAALPNKTRAVSGVMRSAWAPTQRSQREWGCPGHWTQLLGTQAGPRRGGAGRKGVK